jgi:hypothetical protein
LSAEDAEDVVGGLGGGIHPVGPGG